MRGYLYEPGQTVQTSPLVIEAAEGYFFSHNDHLGTPHRIVSSTGVLSWSADYSAFGGATVTLETISNPHRLPGQYYDEETKLHYNLMRYYDPATGVYLTQDPVGAFVTGANRYGYAYADPVNLTDPTGEIVPIVVAVKLIAASLARELGHQAAELTLCKTLERLGDDCVREIMDEFCSSSWHDRALDVAIGTASGGISKIERLEKLRRIVEKLEKAPKGKTGYRAVSTAELKDIKQNGFRPHPEGRSMHDKWFSESREGAEQYRKRYPESRHIVEAEVPKRVHDSSYKLDNIDGTGPGFAVPSELQRLLKPK